MLKKDKYFLIILLLVIIGAFLRFYRFDAFVTFLGDQGRDAIVLRDIVTFKHFPAIGPVTSIGNVYLGPFYYYFIAPWLALFTFDPIGPAVGVGIFSTLTILISYFIVAKLFDKKTALAASVFITFSSALIEFSRFSWNPNLLPLFSLLTTFFFVQAFATNQKRYFALAGAFLSFSIQLHYLALFLIPPILLISIIHLVKKKTQLKNAVPDLAVSICSFLLFSVPLIIFDLRHNFLNSKSFLALFQSTGAVASDKIANFLSTASAISTYAFAISPHPFSWIPFVVVMAASLFFIFRSSEAVRNFLLFFVVGSLGVSLFGGPKYPHYFAAFYSLYYAATSYFLIKVFQKKLTFLLILFFIGYLGLSWQKYYYFRDSGSYQIAQAKKISRFIYDNNKAAAYSLTAIPEVYSDYAPRYFLHAWGKPPQDRSNPTKTDELFVICEKPCRPIGNPLYDIAYFEPRKIAGRWKAQDVTIYKLTR